MGFIKSNNETNSYLSTDIRNIFVGRAKEVNSFIRETLEPEDPTYNIISIWGNPGVGKSTLLTKFIGIAREPTFKEYCLAAQVDERQVTPSSIMEKIADQLRIAGYPLIDFEQVLYTYNEALHNLRVNQSIEQKIFIEGSVLTSATPEIRNNSSLHRYLGDGINSATQDFEASYRYRQLFKDIERIDDPIAELTNAFISDLNLLANTSVALNSHPAKQHQRRVLLFFDSFEQLANDVTPWLLEYFLEANISANVVLVVAGHVYIERSVQSYQRRWQKHKSIIYSISLGSFTENEALEYFNVQGITNADHISILWRLSEGLPYSLSLLTSSTYREVDVTKNVVDNFLRGIPESQEIKRKLALEASLLSRPFNQDDLKAFTYLTEKNRAILYRWLCEQPFVHSNPLDGRHNYHDLARNNFSRYLYQDSPERYRSTREALVSHYQQLLESIQAETGAGIYKTAEWLELVLALTYQLFLLPDEGSHINAIEKILEAYKHTAIKQDGEIIRFLRGISEDGPTNMATKDAQHIAISLIQYIETGPEKRVQEFLAATSFFIQKLSQIVPSKSLLLANFYCDRGNAYESLTKDEQALADFNRAIASNSSYVHAYTSRAEIYRKLNNYNDALIDLDRAIQLDPNNEGLFMMRGQIYHNLNRDEDALLDFDYAIKLDMGSEPLLYMLKGQLLFNMRRYTQANDSLTKGLMEDPELGPCWELLAQVYRKIHPYQEIPALLKTLSIPKADSKIVIIYRALALNAIRHYEEALADLIRIIELEPQNIRAIIELGITYSNLERYEEAISNFTLALEFDSNNVRALICRGVTYHYLKRYTDALHDYNRANGLQPNHANLFIYRSNTYRYMGQFKEALKDLDSAIKLNPRLTHTILEKKGEVLQAMGNNYEALSIFIEALNTQQNCLECWINLAKEYGNLYTWGEVPRFLREVKVIDEKDASVIACRGTSMYYLNCHEEALIELDIALKIDPENEIALLSRSRVYNYFDMHQKALQDLDTVIKLDRYGKHELKEERGESLQELGKNKEAHDTFIEALKYESSRIFEEHV